MITLGEYTICMDCSRPGKVGHDCDGAKGWTVRHLLLLWGWRKMFNWN